jgi:hypothetical protein
VPQICEPVISRLIVHYDLHSFYSEGNNFDYIHELISNSDSVTVLTLCASRRILIQRNRKRMVKILALLLLTPSAYRQKISFFSRQWKLQGIFKNKYSVYALYKKWFSVVDKYGVTSYWLDSGKPDTLLAHPYKTAEAELITDMKNVIDGV